MATLGMFWRWAIGAVIHDQAEIVIYAQNWAASYDEQVPVYAWVVGLMMRATNYFVLTPDFLKYAGLAGTVAGLYLAGKAMTGSGRAGLIAALIGFALPTLHSDLLREYTHSSALLAFAALSAPALIGPSRVTLARVPLGLSLVWVGGILSKHTMVLIMLAQLFELLRRPRPPRGGRMRACLAVLVAVVAVAPIYIDMALNLPTIAAGAAPFVADGGRWRGLLDLGGSILSEGAPLLLVLLLAWLNLRRVQARRRQAVRGRLTPDEATLLRVAAISIGLLVPLIVIGDVAVVRDRWLAPAFLFVAPVVASLFHRAEAHRVQWTLVRVLPVILLALAFFKGGEAFFNRWDGDVGEANYPHGAIRRAVLARGEHFDAVVSGSAPILATLKVHEPDLRVYSGATLRHLPRAARHILLIETDLKSRWPVQLDPAMWQCGPPHVFYVPYHIVTSDTFRFGLRACDRIATP